MKVQKLTYREYWGYYWRVTDRHAIPGIFDWDKDLVDLIVSTCRPRDGADIVDLGCAGGDQAKLLAAKGYQVTGIDQVPDLIEYARDAFRRENLEGHFQVGDIRQIDFENCFDPSSTVRKTM
jgi:2-polyprenyl-3-methyl-5-hydroxy-6-metoxy-1,4-benzoquinol methylase